MSFLPVFDVWHSAVVKYGSVNSRILCIKFKFSRVKVCVVVGYGSNEGDGEERDFGTIWTGLRIVSGIDIDCAFSEI